MANDSMTNASDHHDIAILGAGSAGMAAARRAREADFAPLSEMVSAEDRHILVKLIVERATGTVLGLHVCGENGAETSQLAAALIAGGVSEHDLHRTIALYPTNAEEIIGLGRARRTLDQIIDS